MSSNDTQSGGRTDSARKYAAPRHDAGLVGLVDEVEHISHRGIETDPWEVVSTVTSAVMCAFADATATTMAEQVVLEETLDQMETIYEEWFDPSTVDADQNVTGVKVHRDIVKERYWGGDLNPVVRQVSVTDYEDLKRVTVPVVGLVVDRVIQNMAADRSAEVAAGREAIRDAVVREVLERDLKPEDVEEGVKRALTQLRTREQF